MYLNILKQKSKFCLQLLFEIAQKYINQSEKEIPELILAEY